ncbi:hypothetical protein PUND_a2874 [Pseudoalteromonas undina]|nr:hypothetical protein PUND_a2874 [Pseudoalteromonas undina]
MYIFCLILAILKLNSFVFVDKIACFMLYIILLSAKVNN